MAQNVTKNPIIIWIILKNRPASSFSFFVLYPTILSLVWLILTVSYFIIINIMNFNKKYKSTEDGIDQLTNLIDDIKSDPNSRRLIITDFNPAQAKEGVLYPCHSLILQFYVNDRELSVKMYQRSADVFLGLPFNIASTSLLLYIIAKLTDLNPKNVTITLGDCHLYEEHFKSCREQLSRVNYELPKLELPNFKTLQEVENTTYEDYRLINYNYHPGIKAKMIA